MVLIPFYEFASRVIENRIWKKNPEKSLLKKGKKTGIENDLMQNLTYRHDGTYFVEKLIKYKCLLRRHRENVFAISSTEKKI